MEAPTPITPDTDPGEEEEAEWVASLTDYSDEDNGTPLDGVVVPTNVPVPDGQDFGQLFPTISEPDMEGLLQGLFAAPPTPLPPPTDLNPAIPLQPDQVNQISQSELHLNPLHAALQSVADVADPNSPGNPVVNQLSNFQQMNDQIQQMQSEIQNTVESQIMNTISSYSRSRQIGTMETRQQVLSAPPRNLQLLSPQLVNGNLLFTFVTVTNRSYTLSANTDLGTPNWVTYTNFVGDGYPSSVSVPAQLKQRYFRASTPSQ